jgi:DNA-binding MarR family transcriptional regulator
MTSSTSKDLPRYECIRSAAERYPELDPEGCAVLLTLLHTTDVIKEAESRFLAEHRLSQGRFVVMVLLHDRQSGSMKSSELADEAAVSRATMTGLLDSLERDGFIRREVDRRDRRVTNVSLTGEGRETLKRVLPGYVRCLSGMVALLDQGERQQLAALSRKIQTKLQSSGAAGSNGDVATSSPAISVA